MDFYGILFDMKNGKKIPYSKNYFDTMFAAKLEELGVKTITGTLPLTFRTSETALRSWTIYGNNTQHNYSAEGTLPLTFTTHTAGNAVDWSISGNDEVGENLFNDYQFDTTTPSGTIVYIPVAVGEGTFTLSTSTPLESSSRCVFFIAGNVSTGASNTANGIYNGVTRTVTAVDGFVTVAYRNVSSTKPGNYDTMLVKGTTAPDHYIPYQQGVGERTENLFDGAYSVGFINGSGQYVEGANARCAFIKVDANTQYSIRTFDVSNRFYIALYDHLPDYNDTGTLLTYSTASTEHSYTLTTRADTMYIGIYVSNQNEEPRMVCIKGSTAPSSYVPFGYEIPISTQGKNLFDKSNLVTGSYYTAQGQTGNSDDWSRTVNAIPVLPSTEYTFESNSTAGASAKHLYLDADKNFISAIASGGSTFITPSNCYYMQFSLRTSSTNVMLVKGSTVPTEYIPYFHNDYTFYIGSSPLTAGQSISKTSTGVDIELFEGENTVDTTLYNKPETSISYVDYVGVGEYVNGQWQIPLSVTCDRNLFNIYGNMGASGGIHVIDYNTETSSITGEMPANSFFQLGVQNAIVKGDETFVISFDKSTAGTAELRMVKGEGSAPEILETFDISEIKSYRIVFECEESFGNVYPRLVATETATHTFEHIMIKKASDKGEFVPYGAHTDYTIPIDAPLTEGESITDTQTISTFEGENKIDTTMANKPNMSITYKGG